MKNCQYCGELIEYSASRTRGAWYAKGGRVCPIATAEFGVAVEHRPIWNTTTKNWE